MLIFGFVCSILIGISLGLIGSGGSILMMPVLVYLFLVNHYLVNNIYLVCNVFNSSSNFSILDDKLFIIVDISFIPSNNTELN